MIAFVGVLIFTLILIRKHLFRRDISKKELKSFAETKRFVLGLLSSINLHGEQSTH